MNKNLWCTVSDGINQYWFQIFRNTTSPVQWYLQIGMLDVCGSLTQVVRKYIKIHYKPTQLTRVTYKNIQMEVVNNLPPSCRKWKPSHECWESVWYIILLENVILRWFRNLATIHWTGNRNVNLIASTLGFNPYYLQRSYYLCFKLHQ